jgi:hypothetical protein
MSSLEKQKPGMKLRFLKPENGAKLPEENAFNGKGDTAFTAKDALLLSHHCNCQLASSHTGRYVREEAVLCWISDVGIK